MNFGNPEQVKISPFIQRREDLKTLMGWGGWNQPQAKLLLKMLFDIELVRAAGARKMDKTQDENLRDVAGQHAFYQDFIDKHKISNADWKKIMADPVRAYETVFIRRRLTLPHDPEYYKSGYILPTLRPSGDRDEARRKRIAEKGKAFVNGMERRLAKIARIKARIKRFIEDGEPQSQRSVMRELGITQGIFRPLYKELKHGKTAHTSSRLVYHNGQYLRIPFPGREDFSASYLEREAYKETWGKPYPCKGIDRCGLRRCRSNCEFQEKIYEKP
jgi:hypothetical protein